MNRSTTESSPQTGMFSSDAISRALQSLVKLEGGAACLFDASGRIMVGPVAGDPLTGQIITTTEGAALLAMALRGPQGEGDPQQAAKPLVAAIQAALDVYPMAIEDEVATAQTLAIGLWKREALYDPFPKQLAEGLGLDASALTIAAESVQPHRLGAGEKARRVAQGLAELIGLLSAQEHTLRHRMDELEAVYKVSGLVAGTHSPQEVLDRITELVCEVMNVKACSLRLLDEQSGLLSIKAVHNLSAEYLDKGPVTVAHNLIDASVLAGEVVQIPDMPNDPRIMYPAQARKEGLASGLICGVVFRNKPLGVLRVYTSRPHVFSAFEESLLKAIASQAAAAIVNTRLLEETLAAERYARQIADAGEIQRRMIPSTPPCCRQLDIGTVYRPTYLVGGDFYDFIVLPGENLGLAIADVSGKGVPASLLMASVRSALRVNAYHMYDVDRIVSEVNRHLSRDTLASEFATLFYGVLDTGTGRLTYCNAGHDPPMLLRDGKITCLEKGGMVAGIDPDARYERGWFDLKRGDVMLLYTDGAVEALNFADEQFGRARLADALQRHADQPAERIAKSILWDIRRFRGLAERIDDLSLVVIRYRDRQEADAYA